MKKAPKQKEYVIRKDQNTGEISTKQVPNGTLETYKARIVSLKKGVSFAGLEVEKLYDLKAKIYSPQRLTGDNLLSFRPPHTQELKTSLANAHESDTYMKRITGFYTDYTFGDRIRPIVMPLMVDPPKSKDCLLYTSDAADD